MATVLTAIVFVFIICHAPKAALNIFEVSTVSISLRLELEMKMKNRYPIYHLDILKNKKQK